ncbi:MAG: undecaprenyldiphospho-muramoylpentapeptide beta-N-acetylglucosaminyltransferase [Tannerellaceae bacterium]|nr:undecaprenyldiphospho-muramoylpentapeptide beta-N-acetylglucosaminyltransferase [Tannerellaceae bacterium]
MQTPRFIISGGGTGGHIFPALAIADCLKKRYPSADILFVGADDRMEMERVPAAGYPIVGLPVSGFDRSGLLSNVRVLGRLFRSLREARRVVRDFRPHVVIGVGGYASGPTLYVASRQGVPILIQEQNSYAGVTNRLLGNRAAAVCVAYEGMEKFFPADNIVLTGNPVRQGLALPAERRAEAAAFFGLNPKVKTLLVVGGSLGARTLNSSVVAGLQSLSASGVQLIWQIGKYYRKEADSALRDYAGAAVWRSDFIVRMDYAYAAADLVISRAGAGAISELCLLGKAAILVPSPNVAEDHQTKNATALVRKEAALLITDAEAPLRLIPTALTLIADDERLDRLRHRIATLAIPESVEKIADAITNLLPPDQRR